jgi:hypothetical protein
MMKTQQAADHSTAGDACQSVEMDLISEEAAPLQKALFFLRRGARFARIRARLLRHRLSRRKRNRDRMDVKPELEAFRPGDVVRVKSRKEILETLDGWRRYKGCRFMDEMWKYCGGTYTVYKKVNFILNEKTVRMRRFSHVYLLEGLICDGTWPFKNCDRSCFYFWRAEWLERVR